MVSSQARLHGLTPRQWQLLAYLTIVVVATVCGLLILSGS